MTPIPEEVMQAAEEVVNDYPLIVRQALDDIARAILAERERNALLAREIGEETACGEGEIYIATKIEAAIRKGEVG